MRGCDYSSNWIKLLIKARAFFTLVIVWSNFQRREVFNGFLFFLVGETRGSSIII